MIVFDLSCSNGHVFEGWFGSSGDFSAQKERGLVSCPQCGTAEVSKAPMAPAVPRKGNQVSTKKGREAEPAGKQVTNVALTPEIRQALGKLAEAQAKALEKSKWVGKSFAEDARAMHYGERDAEAIHGEATLEDAHKLVEEGIEVAPLPFPVAPPKGLN